MPASHFTLPYLASEPLVIVSDSRVQKTHLDDFNLSKE